jgi:hypothetical protein
VFAELELMQNEFIFPPSHFPTLYDEFAGEKVLWQPDFSGRLLHTLCLTGKISFM